MAWRSKYGWIYGVGLLLAITGMSRQTFDTEAAYFFPHQDKVIHILVYGLVATAWLRWFLTYKAIRMAAIWAICITSLFGIADEIHQSFVPGRFADVADWLADTLGAVLATFCYLKWSLYRSILEWPKRSGREAKFSYLY